MKPSIYNVHLHYRYNRPILSVILFKKSFRPNQDTRGYRGRVKEKRRERSLNRVIIKPILTTDNPFHLDFRHFTCIIWRLTIERTFW